MNKKLFLGMFAAAGMLFATSCSNDELDPVQSSSDQAQVTFSLGLEGGMATRAISDGTGAKKLVYAVYKLDAQDNPVLQPVVGSDANSQFVDDKAFDNGLTETVSVTLAKGQTYQIAFWAQDGDCKAYNTADLTSVKVSYKTENSTDNAANNDELRDAFFKTVQFTVEGDKVIDNIFLKRVFAQINVGVYKSDWEAAVKSGIEIEKSSVVIKNAATSINLLTGEVGDETTDVVVSYAAKEIPAEDLKVDLNNDGDFNDKDEMYKWLSMSYILVADRNADSGNGVLGDERSALESLTYTFVPKSVNSGNNITIDNGLNNIPVQRNWRTNILGKILTGDIQFNITIDPGYIGDYNSQEILEEVLKNGGEVTLFSDATLSDSFTIPAGKEVKINLNGNTLNVNSTNTVNGSLEVSNGDLSIDIDEQGTNFGFYAKDEGKVDFNDVNVTVAEGNGAVNVIGNNVSVNLNKTNMTINGSVSQGIFAFGPSNNRYNGLKVSLTESTITGNNAIYVMWTDATIVIDEKSSANKIWVCGANTVVDVVYSGVKPTVGTDNTGNTINFYTENQFALKEVLENGGTMKLDSDFTIDEAITVVADKDITIDLDDNTLTIESVSKLAGNLTIKNGTINVAIPREDNGMYAAFKPEGNGYVKVENATVTVAQGNSLVAIYEGDRSSMNAVIDIINSNITVNQGGNGILVPFNVNYVEVNLEKSTISGPDGFIVLETITKALITLDAESSIENIMVADGNVTIVSAGAQPTVNGSADITNYTKAQYDLLSAFENGQSEISLVKDENYGTITIDELKDVTITGAEGATMIFKTTADTKIENVTLKNVNFEYTGATDDCGVVINENAKIDNLVIDGCNISGTGVKKGRGISGKNANASIAVKNCTFDNIGYPIYAWGGYESLIIENCTFKNIVSWAIMPQSGFDGDLTVTGCTFENCKGGLIKAGTLTVGHTFTFTNNIVTNSTEHPNRNWFEFNVSAGFKVLTGNKMDGQDWTPDIEDGLK